MNTAEGPQAICEALLTIDRSRTKRSFRSSTQLGVVVPVNLVITVGLIWWLGVVAHNRREKARNHAADYQMSDAWLARWHLANRAPSRKV